VPLLAAGLYAAREGAALSKVIPRCVAQAARSMGMVPIERQGQAGAFRSRTRARVG
jgi:hypothetical protein